MEDNGFTREDKAYVYATRPFIAFAMADKDYVFSEEDRRIQEVARIAYERGGEDEYKLLTKWNDGSILPRNPTFIFAR